jgi:hypothetical protein
MTKILLGLILLTSMSSFASTVKCNDLSTSPALEDSLSTRIEELSKFMSEDKEIKSLTVGLDGKGNNVLCLVLED